MTTLRPASLLHLLLFLPLLPLLSACDGDTPVDVEIEEGPDLAWLEENAIPFATAQPGTDDSDLAPLVEIVGDARVVSLGEATHGTREFFRMKHRILEFLVREMDFRHFAIEATWAEANYVNDFVLTGTGDPAELLRNLHYWTWNTQEVLDLILWMREYNLSAPPGEAVSFFGFDMSHSTRAMDDVWEYLLDVDVPATSVAGPGYTCWRIWQGALGYGSQSQETKEWCREGVESVHAMLSDRREEYEAFGEEAYARALRAARTVVQHEHQASRDWVDVEPSPRERYMAENVEWLLERAGPDAKMVLWAHNAHVMDVVPWMGSWLRERYGEDMVIAGFSFHRGPLNAVSTQGLLTALGAPGAREGSYEHYFQQLDMPRFFVDLRPLRTSPPESAEWLRGPLPFRLIGAGYSPQNDESYYAMSRLPDDYDVMIHFELSNPSTLLPFESD